MLLLVICLDRLISTLTAHIAKTVDAQHIKQLPFNIFETFEETQTRKLFGGRQEDRRDEVRHLAYRVAASSASR
jgi:hypothetical protein